MTARQEQIDLLLDAGWEGDVDAFTPVLLANVEVIDGKEEEHGRTALLLAALRDHIAIVQLLLERNADVDLQDYYGGTALMVAAGGDHIAIVQLLLERNAVVDVQANDGYTALMVAAGRGHIATVQLLLEHHADIAPKTTDGETALMVAVKNDKLGAARVLMEHKALLLSDDAALAEYSTKYSEYPPVLILVPPILILVKQELNWRRRKPWLLFWLALRRSVVVAPSGTLTLQKKVLSFDFVGRKVASYL